MSIATGESYRFEGDASQLLAELARMRAGLNQAGSAAVEAGKAIDAGLNGNAAAGAVPAVLKKTGDAAEVARKKLGDYRAGAKLTANELTQVGYQLQDFFVQVQGGSNPLTALIQQGSQLASTFGGVGNAVRALLSLITPAVIGVGALAAAGVAAAAAFLKGSDESRELNRNLILTGNYAGQTAGSMNELARRIAAVDDRPISDVRAALSELVKSAAFGPELFEPAARAVGNLQRFSGESAEAIVADFAKMRGGVTKWATEANQKYNVLTAAQLQHIRQLESEGRATEAAAEALGALNGRFEKQRENLGLIDSTLKTVRTAWGRFWDAALDIGRDETVEDKIAKARAALADFDGRRQGTVIPRGGFSAEREAEQENLRLLLRSQQAQRAIAEGAAREAADQQKKIQLSSREHQDALASIDSAGAQRRLAAADLERDRALSGLRDSWERQIISARGFAAARYAIDNDLLKAKEAAINSELELERRRVVATPDERLASEARIAQIETQRLAITRERFDLQQRLRRNELAPDDLRAGSQSAAQQFARFERERQQQTDDAVRQSYADRLIAARGFAIDLEQQNRQTSASLIVDEEQRGRALLAVEAAVQRKRLDDLGVVLEDRQRGEDALAEFVALRQQQLTEELKPEYQKQLAAWQDRNRLMRDSMNELNAGWLREGEDAWVKFAETGKFNARNLVNFVRDELARLVFRQQIAPAYSAIGQAIAGAASSYFGGGANYGNEGNNYQQPIQRERGGTVKAGGMFEVNEGGKPELLRVGRRTMLMMGSEGGSVEPMRRGRDQQSQQQSPASEPTVNVQIIGAPSTPRVESSRNSSGGADVRVIFEQFRQELTSDVLNGGPFASALSSQMGASRVPGLGR